MLYVLMEHENTPAVEESDKIGHYCGVAAVFSKKPFLVAQNLFYMLFSLQHRGQEACGLAFKNKDEDIVLSKNQGMVANVLGNFALCETLSNIGVGHVRYSTAGGSSALNAQPIVITCAKGKIALSHNGNISNSKKLHDELSSEGAIFQTTSDSEIVLHLIARSKKNTKKEILSETFSQLEGAFSFCILWDNDLILARDSYGFRPLYYGEKDEVVFAASETCALFHNGTIEYKEVLPGEVIIISETHNESFQLKNTRKAHCVFELIYFARPDSEIYSKSVYAFRDRLGQILARKEKIDADVIIPVPDSGSVSAIGFASANKKPFALGLARNHYAGRSFILPTKDMREHAVRLKLHPIKEVIKNKKVIMIDDSLVRGTTSKIIVKLLKEAGTKEIHLRLASPEVHFPCKYGIDIPTPGELISNRLNANEIAEYIGADSVRFLSLEELKECTIEPCEYCFSCFDGKDPE